MKEFWNTIQLVFAAIGGWLGYFLGGCDGLLYALLAFVVIDYITGDGQTKGTGPIGKQKPKYFVLYRENQMPILQSKLYA